MPLTVLPDAAVVAREALVAQPLLTDEVDNRVYFAIPADRPGEPVVWPLVVLSAVDDDELRPETLTCRVQVDVWGIGPNAANTLAARDIARAIRAVARDMNGDWPSGKIRNCVAGRIIPNPDTTGGRARFIVDLTFELNA